MASSPDQTPRVTQKDVARAAGVSHVTVSLALRGQHEIPVSTRERIRAIAKRLGYSPDPMLKALSAYRSAQKPAAYRANLAWIINHPRPEEFYLMPEFALFLAGARQRAAELGYGLEPIHLAEYGDCKRSIQRMLAARGISALLIAPVHVYHNRLDLDWARYSAVRIGYSLHDIDLHAVSNNQYLTSYSAMENLARLGFRRIGYLTEQNFNTRTHGHFLGGFLSASNAFQMEDSPILVLDQETNRQGCVDAHKDTVMAWIETHRPEALVVSYRQFYDCLVRWGAKIPQDLSVVTLQADEDETLLAGMHQNARKIGIAAVDLLVSVLERHETGIPHDPVHVLVSGAWKNGTTTRQKPQAPRGGPKQPAPLK